ncbi:MAG TPA: serine hydrolase domain-containing protein [Tepidisphaeraceae bacterium]|nr:serine hydrolase domain-containing protein [Tepidisphaeraceae bacterium]
MFREITDRRSFLVQTAVAGIALLEAGRCLAAPRDGARAGGAKPGGEWKPRVDADMEKMLRADNAPGAALGVVRAGKVVYTKGYGRKNLPDGGVPDADTVFYIGSLSKALTAVGAMLLVEHGKLKLDAPAGEYIKDLPAAWRHITIRQYMSHTSGIPQISRKAKTDHETIDEVYKEFAGSKLTSPPGGKEEYNNFNFAIIGNVIEKISGLSYMEYMTRRVFKPLGMDHTGIGNLSPANHALGYERNKAGKLKESQANVVPMGTPSGGLESTIADLLKLDEALRTNTLLKPRAFKQMITPVEKFNATPGWFVRKAGKYTIVNKDGAAGGFSSLLSFVPGHGHAVIILRNMQGTGVSLTPVTNEIFHTACDLPTIKEGRK